MTNERLKWNALHINSAIERLNEPHTEVLGYMDYSLIMDVVLAGKALITEFERLQFEAEELAQATSEGHVTVLPCNLGATVYWISRFGTGIKQGTVTAIKISAFGFDLEISQNQEDHLTVRREFEKVFLTYEEAAEAAMGR